jgi:hypothetical protein
VAKIYMTDKYIEGILDRIMTIVREIDKLTSQIKKEEPGNIC